MAVIFSAVVVIIAQLIQTSVSQWSPLGVGVAYRDYGFGKNVLIAYGGYSVSDTLSRHWADRLINHSPLKLHDVGKVYAVKGPDDSLYRGREIANSKLISHLLANQNAGLIVVLAHSSGAFVANEFFSQLYRSGSPTKTDNKIVYYNLDGAGGLSSTAKSKLNKEYFVYARDGSLLSRNAGTMKSLATGDELVELDGSNSQCRHYNCLHDVMIIRHPWDPMKFDLSRDYGLFSVGDREVQYDYITKTLSRLSGLSRG